MPDTSGFGVKVGRESEQPMRGQLIVKPSKVASRFYRPAALRNENLGLDGCQEHSIYVVIFSAYLHYKASGLSHYD